MWFNKKKAVQAPAAKSEETGTAIFISSVNQELIRLQHSVEELKQQVNQQNETALIIVELLKQNLNK